jgi:hypothetical protein
MSIDPSSLDTQNLLVKPVVPLSPHVFDGILENHEGAYIPKQPPQTVEISDTPSVTAYVPLAKMDAFKGTITDVASIADLKTKYSTPLPESESPVTIQISDHRKKRDQPEYVMPGIKSAAERPDYLNKARPSGQWQDHIASQAGSAGYENAVFTLHLVNSPAEAAKNIHQFLKKTLNTEPLETDFNSVYDNHKIQDTYSWYNTLNPEENRKALFTNLSNELTNGFGNLQISEVG